MTDAIPIITMITTCQYANFVLFPRNVILFGKMEAIDKIRRNSVRNEALNDFLSVDK